MPSGITLRFNPDGTVTADNPVSAPKCILSATAIPRGSPGILLRVTSGGRTTVLSQLSRATRSPGATTRSIASSPAATTAGLWLLVWLATLALSPPRSKAARRHGCPRVPLSTAAHRQQPAVWKMERLDAVRRAQRPALAFEINLGNYTFDRLFNRDIIKA